MNMNRVITIIAILAGLMAVFGQLVAFSIQHFMLSYYGWDHPSRYLMYAGELVESLCQSLAIVLVAIVAYRITLSK